MARPIWCVLLALILGFALSAPIDAQVEAGDAPPDFTPEQFKAMSGTYFIKFYSPYCAHCRQLAPKWDGAYRDLGKQETQGFKWAGVNCVDFADFCNENEISSYPTLRLYRNAKRVYDYSNSGASQADLRSFANEYIRLGDGAFDTRYETAPKDVQNLEQANFIAENQAKEAEKLSQEKPKIKQEELVAGTLEAQGESLSGESHVKGESATKDGSEPTEHSTPKTVVTGGITQEGTGPAVEAVSEESLPKEATISDKEPNVSVKEDAQLLVQPPSSLNTELKQPEEGESPAPAEPRVDPGSQPNSDSNAAAEDPLEDDKAVTILHASDFGPDTNVGRWFVLFTGVDCEECEPLKKKWAKHDNFARSIDGINWGRVDCAKEEHLCDVQGIKEVPSLRIYHDGAFAYNYDGSHDTMALRNFLQYAATASNFDGFSLSDLDTAARSGNPDTHIEGAGPNQEPNYLTGPVVSKPNYGTGKPKILDVVQYTLDTLGKPINEDPGKLIFSASPETHHNFRTWGASNAPPPAFIEPTNPLTHATGSVYEFSSSADFENLVKQGSEPWMVKFYSPKCPHCREMAAAYDDLAFQMKHQLNIGAVNCETNSYICDTENITHWPFITLYRGPVAMEEFTGPRTAADMAAYAARARRAQIHPIEAEDELAREIVINNDNNITTFVYLYDQSVMPEDWDSLIKVANNIDKWGGKLYRANSETLRELAGIKHRGTAFVLADYAGKLGEGQLKWYDYPWSNIPKKIRDADELSNWAFRAKWTSLQYFDPYAQTQFSPYIAVLLTNGSSKPSEDEMWYKHQKLALDMREFYVQRQIEDQDQIRIDRLRQHDQALIESKFRYARYLMKQPIETPVVADLAFAYIPYDQWVQHYQTYFDISKHHAGDVIVVGCYDSIYLDEFNLVPIKDDKDVLDDAVELLHRYQSRHPKTTFRSIRHFKTSMHGIAKPEPRPLHFLSKPYADARTALRIPTIMKIALCLGILYVVYIKSLRPRLRRYASRNRASFDMQAFPKHE